MNVTAMRRLDPRDVARPNVDATARLLAGGAGLKLHAGDDAGVLILISAYARILAGAANSDELQAEVSRIADQYRAEHVAMHVPPSDRS